MKKLLLGTFILSISAVAQQGPTGSAKTSGSCSPALNGNNNVITISCTGISPKKADDLLKVMNQILARQLDLKQVNDQLTQIHSDVENLNSSLNPLNSASPAQTEFLQQATKVIVDCFNLSQHWGQLLTGDDARSNRDAINQSESAHYQSAFMPKAVLLRDKLFVQLPGETGSGVDYGVVHNMGQLGGVCMDLNTLGTQYKNKLTDSLRAKRTSVSR